MRGTLTTPTNGRGKSAPIPASTAKPKPRASGKADKALGQKIRARRSEVGISQTELGDKLGVSFQQIQKYEKGVNRVTAGRLQQIAAALDTNIAFFLNSPDTAPMQSDVQDYIMSRDGLDMIKAMIKVPVPVRRKFIALARALGGDEDGDE